ncbi:MAG: SDR family NAD(P)-dependent oxidoreductase [Gammaproteobacteria bacterium]|nr:SDR family NAD(P)-dependent oxidoreductase [Gammaproteobacteria bacterium]
MQIVNKIVLITGASSGIGAAIAKAASQAGADRILLLARSERRLGKVADEIKSEGGKAIVYPVDLADPGEVQTVTQRILDQEGVPDILINNAGIGRWRFLCEMGTEEITDTMALPYFATAWVTRAFLPAMLERDSGHIVNISSVASRLAWPGATAYIAACRAMRGFSDALRSDLHGTRISVTHYESGPIDSPYWQNNPGSRERVPGIAKLLVPVISEDQVARAVVKGVSRNKQSIVMPTMLRVVYVLHRVFPWLVQGLMTRTGYRSPS